MIIKIPSKSILFGEYGVLYGFTGIVVHSWAFHCEFDFQIAENRDVITIYSSYFSSGILRLSIKKIVDISQKLPSFSKNSLQKFISDPDERFFTAIFIPYAPFLTKSFSINILKFFDKSLGFGSSSAIISAMNLFLKKLFNLSESEMWDKIKTTIKLLQNIGSGYDIAVQIKNAIIDTNPPQKNIGIWKFQNRDHIPSLSSLDIHGNFGAILKTGIYSETSETLSNFNKNLKKNYIFAQKNAILAESFLKDHSKSNITQLINKSLNLQKEHNLTIESIDNLFCDIHFKYLGSGKGDTVWTINEDLDKIQNQRMLYKIIL